MDIKRNLQMFSTVEQKYQIKIKTHDPENRLSIKNNFKVEPEVTVSRFDSDDTFLAAGCSNGTVYIFDSHKLDKKPPLVFQTGQMEQSTHLRFPTTAIRWRAGDNKTQNKYVLITANADGTVYHWDTKIGASITSFKEELDNEIFAIDLNINGSLLATGGKDSTVRIYDEETQKLNQKLTAIQWASSGHNNRIFSVKFSDTDPNLVISGGSDLNVVIWDVRQTHSVATILGPKIAGDTIDIQGGIVLTGSNKMTEQLQLWDLGTQKLIENIKWDQSNDATGAFIFAAQFSKQKIGLIAGAASGTNEVKIFEQHGGFYKSQVGIGGFQKGLYGFDFGNMSNKFAFGGGDGLISIFTISQYGTHEDHETFFL